ncbi:hypothetical protein FHX52_3227 [Humibacillus xanthopallidus]|uniref:SprT-like family protein n=1 Tax=Humibacillus xanthopallidus TaxID=412689 RepID=A0A543PQZ7_9MICO|nr:hypothetical protein [Humibacillus xanthopallidus]TQN46502.1 hypothetical protein FHX52_3227 [Humibacillus xanthopallidus]
MIDRALLQANAAPTSVLAEPHSLLQDAVLTALSAWSEEATGLLEYFQDNIAFHLSLDGRPTVLGSFSKNALVFSDTEVSTIQIHLGEILRLVLPAQRATQLVVTALHELAHANAALDGVKDTSRGGRYHNRKFGRHAAGLGLQTELAPQIGVITTGLAPHVLSVLGDALVDIEAALVMELPGPVLGPLSAAAASSAGFDAASEETTLPKHISAVCACVEIAGRPRRLRMAAGSWLAGPVVCGVCHAPFRPVVGSLSTAGRTKATSGAASPTKGAP